MPSGVRLSWLMMSLVVGVVASADVCTAAESGEAAVAAASAAYVESFNGRDYDALGRQWIERAELVEGGSRVVGREAIVASIRGWLERHPEGTLAIDVESVDLLSDTLARVSGTMHFRRHDTDRSVRSRFESLRTRVGDDWQLVESTVAPAHAAALDDLEWLVGSWRAEDAAAGLVVETVFERDLAGYLLVGRTTTTAKGDADGGIEIESVTMIAADRAAGVVRSWIFDSTGAQASGVVSFDGLSLEQTLAGTPSDTVAGGAVQWVQLIVPAGDGRFTQHSVERMVDGERLPDASPLHFRRIGDAR